MREAHREYPFTGKKDADLIQKAVEVVSLRYMDSFICRYACLSCFQSEMRLLSEYMCVFAYVHHTNFNRFVSL